MSFVSSPRQKMVTVAPSQPNELEQRKKRQTLERAKANHLSKQLQMRLQYAKLKVEHGWQRQNLNEVENLYFHHSHQRNMRQGAGQRTHHATVTYPTGEMHAVQSPAPLAVPDRTVGPSPSANDTSSSGSGSPPSQSPSEHGPNTDGRSSSQSQSFLAAQIPMPLPLASTGTNRPPSTLDLSDPSILARLAQLQGQAQVQTLSRHPSTTIPTTSASASVPQPAPAPALTPTLGAFPPHIQLSQPSTSQSQPGFALPGTPTPTSAPLCPILPSAPRNNLAAPPQPPVPTSTSASASAPSAPIPTTPIPTPAPIAPSALTYDSFWSTHASSAGPTRALYRTHTGFTASAAPGGNVAMLTPGGHAAVMTAEGLYVGGGSK